MTQRLLDRTAIILRVSHALGDITAPFQEAVQGGDEGVRDARRAALAAAHSLLRPNWKSSNPKLHVDPADAEALAALGLKARVPSQAEWRAGPVDSQFEALSAMPIVRAVLCAHPCAVSGRLHSLIGARSPGGFCRVMEEGVRAELAKPSDIREFQELLDRWLPSVDVSMREHPEEPGFRSPEVAFIVEAARFGALRACLVGLFVLSESSASEWKSRFLHAQTAVRCAVASVSQEAAMSISRFMCNERPAFETACYAGGVQGGHLAVTEGIAPSPWHSLVNPVRLLFMQVCARSESVPMGMFTAQWQCACLFAQAIAGAHDDSVARAVDLAFGFHPSTRASMFHHPLLTSIASKLSKRPALAAFAGFRAVLKHATARVGAGCREDVLRVFGATWAQNCRFDLQFLASQELRGESDLEALGI